MDRIDVTARNKPQRDEDGELIKKWNVSLNQHVSFDGCVIMSSSVIQLTGLVLCRSHLTWRTAAMASILRKNCKTNKTGDSVLCSSQPASSLSDLFPLLFISLFSFQHIHLPSFLYTYAVSSYS